jgi:hypothetical protein
VISALKKSPRQEILVLSQGATSGGNFGTVGRGDRSAVTSDRYDTDSTRVREGVQTSGRTLTCFCGNEMRQVGTGKQRAQAARFGSENT